MFKDLENNLWKAVVYNLECLIPYYELGNKIISFGFDNKLRQYIASKVKAKDIVLEIGVGPGSFIKYLKQRKVFCVDPSEKMIALVRHRFKDKNLDCRLGVAENIPFENKIFDKVLCIFSFRDFFDKKRSLREIYRVLKKGGTLIIMDIANMENIITSIYISYLRIIGPIISRLMGFKKNLYDELVKTIKILKPPQYYKQMAEKIGFSKVWIEYKMLRNVFILYAEK